MAVPAFKEKETVKDTYTDAELALLLKRPAKDCDFGEFRSWVVVNFLMNSGFSFRNNPYNDILKSNFALTEDGQIAIRWLFHYLSV